MNSDQLERRPPMISFFVMWTGQAVSLFGSQLVQFALIWWLTQETGSATVLATAAIVGLLPQVLIGPFAGALVDRWNRRITLILADGTVALATLLLAYLFWSGNIQIWQVYLIMFVRAAAGSFHWPAMAASTSLMVPEEHLARIQGLNQTLNGALNIVSAPLAAIMLEFLSVEGILIIDVATALVAILPLLFIYVPQPKHMQMQEAGSGGIRSGNSFLTDLREGLRYVWGWPGLVMIMIMATFINLMLNPAFTMLPLVVTNHFQGGALQLGWLESAWGIGVVAGGLLLGVWGGFRRRITTTLVGLVALGSGVFLFGLVPQSAFWLAVATVFAVGVANPIVNGPALAIIQATTAPEMQGRVFGLLGTATAAMSPIGLLIAGPVADAFGVRIWFIVGGLATVLLGASGFLIPVVMDVEESEQSVSRAGNSADISVEMPEDQPPATAIQR